MQLNILKPAYGAVWDRKRIARGQGSGRGGTATRGHNGAQSRSGYKRKRAFEGGQLPLQKRIPRYGFKNPNRIAYKPINLLLLQQVVDKVGVAYVDPDVLVKHGLVSKRGYYKVLGHGDLKVKVDVHAHAFSKAARSAIEQLGGRAILVESHG